MKDLLDVIGHDAANESGYCTCPSKFGMLQEYFYWDWEKNTATPRLEKLGYTKISFTDGERDSFGPLTRLVRAEKDGQKVEFMYG